MFFTLRGGSNLIEARLHVQRVVPLWCRGALTIPEHPIGLWLIARATQSDRAAVFGSPPMGRLQC